MSLSQAEIDQFFDRGYLGPLTLFEPAVATDLLRRIDAEVLSERSATYAHTRGDPPKVDYTRDRHLDSPLLHRVASSPAIVDRVVSLLGPDVLLWRSDVFAQGPGDPPTYPHQDIDLSGTRVVPCIEAGGAGIATIKRPNGDVALPLCVSAWIAFSTMREATGTLWIVPGTHRAVIPEVAGEGFAGRPFVLAQTFTPSDGVILDVQPGQFILFHNLLVHGSVPAQGARRLAWTTRYVTPETRIYARGPLNAQGQDLARFGSVLVAGCDRAHVNVLRAPPSVSEGSILEERALG